jgi:pre-mRNA-splicing factor SYF2
VATAAGSSDAVEQQRAEDNDADEQEGAGADDGYPQMTEKQKKLFELRLKMVW